MTVDTLAVGNWFVAKAIAEGKPLTLTKLQKLVYFVHGWYLGLTGDPLLDEEIQAWSFGPVSYTLYKAFDDFGSSPITQLGSDLRETQPEASGLPDWSPLPNMEFVTPILNAEELADHGPLLARVWDIYSRYSGRQLVEMTHAPGTPWAKVHDHFAGSIPKYATIPREFIADYFKAQAA